MDEICRCGLGPMPGSVFSAPYELKRDKITNLQKLIFQKPYHVKKEMLKFIKLKL